LPNLRAFSGLDCQGLSVTRVLAAVHYVFSTAVGFVINVIVHELAIAP